MESSFAPSVAPASPARWHRRVLTLAFPIVLANLTQPILSAVDTAVAGHLPGPEYIGGVAAGGVFFNFVFWGFGFLRMGTTGLVSQAHGAGDTQALRASVVRALLLAFAIGAVLLVLQVPAIRITLALLGASESVTRMAEGLDISQYPPMGPELVSPVVAWLAHENCSVTGEMLVSIAGRVARAFIAESKGVYQPSWRPEDVGARIDAIMDSQDPLVFGLEGHVDQIRYSFGRAVAGE